MVYDWDGQSTRQIQLTRLATALTFGLAVPLVITMWSYIN